MIRVLRHYKERRNKCTLQPLVGDARFQFHTWRPGHTTDATGTVVLEIDAPLLSEDDVGAPLLILDSTWRYLPAMRASLCGEFTTRSLPPVATAYPRLARLSANPGDGLASIEAVYFALRLLGQRDDALLDHYHWKAAFLQHCDAVDA